MTEHSEELKYISNRLSEKPGSVHAVGVCGVGMAGMAVILSRLGWKVSGCDAHPGKLSLWLENNGVHVLAEHSAQHVADLDPASDFILVTPAVSEDNPEIAAAIAAGIPVIHRGIALAAIMSAHSGSIAVCGSHGKTTTSTIITLLLKMSGSITGWCIGGVSAGLTGPSSLPQNTVAKLFVAESDESDGTLAYYHPYVTVVTSIDFDHMEHFSSDSEFDKVFASVASNTRGKIVCAWDGEHVRKVLGGMADLVTTGFHPDARIRATEIAQDINGTDFTLFADGKNLGRFRLGLPGLHNLKNALCALGAIFAVDGDIVVAAGLLSKINTLPERRFEVISENGGITLVSDYAHHPTEIAALVKMSRERNPKRILAVFQPHRYSRTRLLADQFPAAFIGVDALCITPVYAASEEKEVGGTAADLYAKFRESGCTPILAANLDKAWEWLRYEACSGDLVLLIGAGDIVSLADKAIGFGNASWIREGLVEPPDFGSDADVRLCVPSKTLCSFRTGGMIQAVANVYTLSGLSSVVKWAESNGLPCTALGCGTNTLVSDTGYNGVAVRFCGVFEKITNEGGGVITAGSGVIGSVLLAYFFKNNLGGLEYMDGIPGTVGGWVSMNAGAHGYSFGQRVISVKVMTLQGTVNDIPAEKLEFDYRKCDALTGKFVLSVTTLGEPDDIAAIEKKRKAFRERRFNFGGLRTAGSIFKNPPGDSAGRILDKAGCKGLRVGRALVSPRHANIICSEEGSTASDILALIDIMQSKLQYQLSPELKILS